MKETDIPYLKLVFLDALLYNITSHARLIAAKVRNEKDLIVWVFLDRPPTNDEKDVYFGVCGIVTGTIPELDFSAAEVRFSTDVPEDEFFRDKMLLFARCDILDSEGNLIELSD